MKNIIKELKASQFKDILVVGDVMLDEYVFGSVSRVSPEAPVPIVKEEKRDWSLGGAANVALNCKKIGCNVELIGIVNDLDAAGQKLFSILAKKDLEKGIVKSPNRVTTSKKRILSQNYQLLRIDLEDSKKLAEFEKEAILAKIDQLLKLNSVVIISDYAKGVIDQDLIEQIIVKAKCLNSLVLVDPKGPDFGKYKGVNFIKPNFKEYKQIVQFFNLPSESSVVENGRKICDLLSLDGLFVTLGEKGIQFISKNEQCFAPAVCKREVFDLTGAGDTVSAFLALGLLNKLEISTVLNLANHAASVAISHLKTYAVSLEELIDRNIEVGDKFFVDWRNLKIELDWNRVEGKKVVFTNGCFDLIHGGHIEVLNEAKKLGDILIVALNSDESIKRLKGDERPIKTLSERAKIISALGFVDFVTFFNEDTPATLIDFIRPDIVAKGGDYKKEDVVGYDTVMSYGGSVEIINHQFSQENGYSTTLLVEKMSKIEKER